MDDDCTLRAVTSTTPTSSTAAPSQAELAYERVRDLLVTLDVPPGAPLGEADLMRRVGVGRTPLREALSRLAAERLVVVHPRRGTFAAEINIADLALITDLRAELEGLAAERAATWATADDRAELQRLVAHPAASDAPADAMALDTRIHRSLYEAAHNPFLVETATRYHNLSMRIWYLFVDRLHDLAGHVDEHRLLVERVVAGDGQGARRAATAHVHGFERAVRALW